MVSLTSSLIHLYQTYQFLRESLQTTFQKLLNSVQSPSLSLKVMEKIVAELLLNNTSDSNSKKPIKEFIFEHSDNLSLFLTLRHAYLGNPSKYQD